MFTSILVPTDGTAESNAALSLARTVARETVPQSRSCVFCGPTISSDREAFSVATNTLKRVAAELSGPDVPVETVVREGDDVADGSCSKAAPSAPT